jgi:16S rRNA (guanine966-N2)-methyltransferase
VRVIAGSARGRPLKAPPGRDVRPTSDRVREALFSALSSRVPGATVLDLFAGSGALGIEALSRGAACAVFVERDPRAADAVAHNLQRAEVSEHATLVRGDADAFARRPRPAGPYDLVFCDPPYATTLAEVDALLEALHLAGALAPAVTVVVERDKRDRDLAAPPPGFLASGRARSYGDTVLLFRHAREESAP